MFVLIYLIIGGAVTRGQTDAASEFAASNRFGTKNSYDASLELWADQPAQTGDGRITACCQPIHVRDIILHVTNFVVLLLL